MGVEEQQQQSPGDRSDLMAKVLTTETDAPGEYNAKVEVIRDKEYPMLKDTIYLDHAGTTLYAKSLVDCISSDLLQNLYGNPHSFSAASLNTSKRTDKVRLQILDFLKAGHDDYDVVFVANATGGVKLVAELLRGDAGFTYAYHRHAHTSLIGMRESARIHYCFNAFGDLHHWLQSLSPDSAVRRVVAFPAQSNMDGRRLPLDWCRRLREGSTHGPPVLSLLDAASLVSTSPLDLSNSEIAPDFTVLSLYKMFGLPDLGALIIRKESIRWLGRRNYFGGGTVDMITTSPDPAELQMEPNSATYYWKAGPIHARLEDGTLPIHSIVAAGHAIDVHSQLFTSLERISHHCAFLADRLRQGLMELRHWNDSTVCKIHVEDDFEEVNFQHSYGPVIAFNVKDSSGAWISNAEVEKLCTLRNICLRTGGVCNPGGVSSALSLSDQDLHRNYAQGKRCDGENDIVNGRPTGIIRASLGAMSTISDIDGFLNFMREHFVDSAPILYNQIPEVMYHSDDTLCVESITIYPIKSCAGYGVPRDTPWPIRPQGLAWDREWCLVSSGSNIALSQKWLPRMALLIPSIDLVSGNMRVTFSESGSVEEALEVSLSVPCQSTFGQICTGKSTTICGDRVEALIYDDPKVSQFFTAALGVSCHLARVTSERDQSRGRGAKAILQPFQMTDAEKENPLTSDMMFNGQRRVIAPILSSNESPILVISRSSVAELNRAIVRRGGKPVDASVFRANIVVGERCEQDELYLSAQAYAEDHWRRIIIGNQVFDMMGSCRRCQMVCIDQKTGVRSKGEPFLTLSKTRRHDGKVWFGQHARHVSSKDSLDLGSEPTVQVGDVVVAHPPEGEDSPLSDDSTVSTTWTIESSD